MQNDVGRIINKFFIEDLTGIKIEDSDSIKYICCLAKSGSINGKIKIK